MGKWKRRVVECAGKRQRGAMRKSGGRIHEKRWEDSSLGVVREIGMREWFGRADPAEGRAFQTSGSGIKQCQVAHYIS